MKDTDFSDESTTQALWGDLPTENLDETEPEPRKERWKIIFPWLMAFLISVVISASTVLVYDRYFATRIAAVDIKGFIAAQRDLYVQGKISEEQLRQNIEALDKTIENIPVNVVVIMGDAVVRNAKVIKP